MDLAGEDQVPQVRDDEPRLIDGDHVAVVQVDNVLRVLDDGGGVRGEEHLVGSDADKKGRSTPRPHQLVRGVGGDDRDPECAPDLGERQADHLGQRLAGAALHDTVHQGDEHLGVCFAAEFVAIRAQLVLEGSVVLNDAVVDQRNGAVGGHVRVGVDIRGRTVGRPPRVPDAETCGRNVRLQARLKFRDLSLLLQARDGGLSLVRVAHSHPGAVIPAVFQALQAVHENVARVPAAEVRRDATHGAQLRAESMRAASSKSVKAWNHVVDLTVAFPCPLA